MADREPNANPGIPLDLDWIRAARVDSETIVERAAGLREAVPEGRSRAEWLIRAVTLLDLTTLSGDDTPERVRRLCALARRPLGEAEAAAPGGDGRVRVAAVCVYHAMVRTAVRALEGSEVPVAAVSAGFPAGLSPLETRVAEIRASVEAGAREIDPVIARYHALADDWTSLYREIRAFREACDDATMKVILATGELGTLTRVRRASLVSMMAGADFVKTSTGQEAENATLPVGLAISDAIREYRDRTGLRVGLKPAGGITRAADALAWLALARTELGDPWLRPARFRFGASGLLADLAKELGRSRAEVLRA